MLTLADLQNYTEQQIIDHLVEEYSAPLEEAQQYKVLVAYESVGDYGCDSNSYFLLQNKEDGELYEQIGSHCSCNGFEDQWGPTITTTIYLQSENFHMYTGGYDDDSERNIREIKKFFTTFSANVIKCGDYLEVSDEEMYKDIAREFNQKVIDDYDVLVAYASNPPYEGYSYLLLRNKATGELWENSSSHCSCNGHDFEPNISSIPYLQSDLYKTFIESEVGKEEAAKVLRFVSKLNAQT